MIIGIDPGLRGALAWWKGGVPMDVVDMPVMTRVVGAGNCLDGRTLAMTLMAEADGSAITHAYVEYVNAAPLQGRRAGAQSMFNFGEGYGILQGVLAALGIPYTMVTPRAWKSHYKLLGKDKDASRSLCLQQFPHFASRLARKKDDGRADALLIGGYGTWMEYNA